MFAGCSKIRGARGIQCGMCDSVTERSLGSCWVCLYAASYYPWYVIARASEPRVWFKVHVVGVSMQRFDFRTGVVDQSVW